MASRCSALSVTGTTELTLSPTCLELLSSHSCVLRGVFVEQCSKPAEEVCALGDAQLWVRAGQAFFHGAAAPPALSLRTSGLCPPV